MERQPTNILTRKGVHDETDYGLCAAETHTHTHWRGTAGILVAILMVLAGRGSALLGADGATGQAGATPTVAPATVPQGVPGDGDGTFLDGVNLIPNYFRNGELRISAQSLRNQQYNSLLESQASAYVAGIYDSADGLDYEVGASAVANLSSGPVADVSLHAGALVGKNASVYGSPLLDTGNEFAFPDICVRVATDYVQLDAGQKYIDSDPWSMTDRFCTAPGLAAKYTPNSALGAFLTVKPFQLMTATAGVAQVSEHASGSDGDDSAYIILANHGVSGFWSVDVAAGAWSAGYSGHAGQVGEAVLWRESGHGMFEYTELLDGVRHNFYAEWKATDRLTVRYDYTSCKTSTDVLDISHVFVHSVTAAWQANQNLTIYARWQRAEYESVDEYASKTEWDTTAGGSLKASIPMGDIPVNLEARGEVTYRETEGTLYGDSESETTATFAIIVNFR